MAVPKKRTSKAKQKKRRTHKGLNTPGGLSLDPSSGEYRMSHRISKDGYYNGIKWSTSKSSKLSALK
ncbi:50S ribosomal protein L32 [Alkalibacterium subtropicum]|uniref:50S ribosomal protein L32 n=1 Tax=Alkalibacterium subtropicum TaxID=753702 RepID=UPI000B806C32|nr:50S ribosomal protein L32 [Alkalibacterium subtropicum]